jgi:hypothetical protein
MSECSLPGNFCAERVIPSYFPIENQVNAFACSFGIHGDNCTTVQEVFAFKKNRQAGEQEMPGNSLSLPSGSLIFLDPLIEMRMFLPLQASLDSELEG